MVWVLQDVPRVGVQGETVQVAKGFARNFLVPKGLAKLVSPAENAVASATQVLYSPWFSGVYGLSARVMRDRVNYWWIVFPPWMQSATSLEEKELLADRIEMRRALKQVYLIMKRHYPDPNNLDAPFAPVTAANISAKLKQHFKLNIAPADIKVPNEKLLTVYSCSLAIFICRIIIAHPGVFQLQPGPYTIPVTIPNMQIESEIRIKLVKS
jgi:ribosomal protein L9